MAHLVRGIGATAGPAVVHRRSIVLWLAAALCGSAAAQSPGTTSPGGSPPSLDLSPAQRQLIYASLSKRTHISTAAPPNFGASIGGTLPESVELVSLPETVVEIVPQLRGHAYAMVAGQVLIVEPQARRIIEIIAESASGVPRGVAV